MLTTEQKSEIIKKYKINEKDTGSPEVQIALLSDEIQGLLGHLKEHPKDNHSRRGLLQMVSDRRALLAYLKKENNERYEIIVKKVGLKKK
jgi:small subunit ribosomal protein S15